MKIRNKKFILKSIAVLFSVISLILNNSANANSHKKTQFTPKGTKYISSTRQLKNISEASRILSRMIQGDKILSGGMYSQVPHLVTINPSAQKNVWEVHHLVSAHFCRNHRDIISVHNAPAVLIPKELHRLTGSYGSSWKSKLYRDKEERVFKKNRSIQEVFEFGLKDLEKAMKKLGFSDKEIIEYFNKTPIKCVQNVTRGIQDYSSTCPPTPLKSNS